MQGAVDDRGARCVAAGATVKDVTLPPMLEDAWRAHPSSSATRPYRALASEYDNRRELLGQDVRDASTRLRASRTTPMTTARRTMKRARQALAELMGDYDVILTPSAPGAAPHGIGSTGSATFNRLWTLMGTPCVNVPGLADAAGLPLGVQIVGRFGRDRAALEAALFAEMALARRS